MIAQCSPDADQAIVRQLIQVFDLDNAMRHADIDGIDRQRQTAVIVCQIIQLLSPRIGHNHAEMTVILLLDAQAAGVGFKGELVAIHKVVVDGEPGSAATAVAAHLGERAVRVIETDLHIVVVYGCNDDDAVGADRHRPGAELLGQAGVVQIFDILGRENDEVVAGATHFDERQMLHVALHTLRTGPRELFPASLALAGNAGIIAVYDLDLHGPHQPASAERALRKVDITMKTALITGITGQDGSYLAELLLDKGYRVVGMQRRTSTETVGRIAHLLDRIDLVQGDLLDQLSLIDLFQRFQPDEVYNLAAQSFVPTSWQQPVLTGEFTAIGVTRVLEALRLVKPDARFYQASSSEMFGKVQAVPQDESTPFYPRSPYGISKLYGHWITINYRESYDLFACSGILFNHESPRRGLEFVTRKITHSVARIKLGHTDTLPLGNLDAQRDWGYAPDYVYAMWLMLQQDSPNDFVVATGRTHTVQRLCELAFDAAGLNWKDHVTLDERFLRPAEVDLLVGDASTARSQLGWEPSVSFEEMVEIMVNADIKLLSGEKPPAGMPTGAST